MLSTKTIKEIAELLKLEESVIVSAIKSETEVSLEIEEGLSSFTKTELSQRDANIKTSSRKEGEQIGEDKGKDLAVKAIKTKLGITDASKDADYIAGVIQTKMSGENSLKEQVTLLQADIAERDKKISELDTKVKSASFDSELLSFLPQNRTTALETAEHLNLVKSNLEFTEEGVKYKGNILREDKSQNALSKKDAIEKFYSMRDGLLVKDEQEAKGRGGGAGGGGGSQKYKTLADVRVDWTAKNPGKVWGSLESQDYLTTVLKDNPDLEMTDAS